MKITILEVNWVRRLKSASPDTSMTVLPSSQNAGTHVAGDRLWQRLLSLPIKKKKTRRLGYHDLQNWISVTTVCPTTFKNIKTANSQQYFPIDKKFASVTVCANKNNFPEKAYFQLFSR